MSLCVTRKAMKMGATYFEGALTENKALSAYF